MSFTAEDLYSLLPSFVRLQDQTKGGGALQALVAVLAGQAQVVSDGLDQLYDDQFIETCAPWAVPYLGELIGFVPLRPLGPDAPSATRAEVADTIGYRRRKGTLAMLEQLCLDVTGWPCIGVEYFTRLATTQYVRNHLRPGNSILDVHSPMTAVDIGGAFDLPPRTLDVRRIDTGRGRYNVPNIGLFVWRLQAYSVSGREACNVGANRYTFDPFGSDVPLVNPPLEAPSFSLQSRSNVPFFLQRLPLYLSDDPALSSLVPSPYASNAPGTTPSTTGAPPCPVGVSLAGTSIDPSEIAWCDLTQWAPPTASGIAVAVDPVLGRLVFATEPAEGEAVEVAFTYAFSGDYGGGDYAYATAAEEAGLEQNLSQSPPITAFATSDLSGYSNTLVTIDDSGINPGPVTLQPDANLLVLVAADFERPVIGGDVTITAVANARVTLRGLGIGGSLTVSGAGPFSLTLEHCSLRGLLDWSDTGVEGSLVLDHSLCAAVEANDGVTVSAADSSIDAGSDSAPAVSGGGGNAAGSVTIARCTVIGNVSARTVPLLENSIVTGAVTSSERQAGCVRYSYVPLASSSTPRRFRCQPDLEIADEVAAALAQDPGLGAVGQAAIAAAVEEWLTPVFTSRQAGQPGYLQLADSAPQQIGAGAEEEDEMGVFNGLYSGRRESNLSFRLSEYLRIGLSAGIIHAS